MRRIYIALDLDEHNNVAKVYLKESEGAAYSEIQDTGYRGHDGLAWNIIEESNENGVYHAVTLFDAWYD